MQILETCLYVNNLEAAKHFYGDILGFTLIAYVPKRHVFFRVAHAMLLIFDPSVTQQETVLPPHGAYGAGHVAFAVAAEALERWQQRLEAAGVPIVVDHRWPNGGRSIYVHDPAGNVVELAPPSIWGLETGEGLS